MIKASDEAHLLNKGAKAGYQLIVMRLLITWLNLVSEFVEGSDKTTNALSEMSMDLFEFLSLEPSFMFDEKDG